MPAVDAHSSETVRFAVLGALEVDGPGGPANIASGKQRAVLAVLLLHAGKVVARDRLVDELWGDAAPPQAVKALQVHIAQLRRSLAASAGAGVAHSVIVTRPPGYMADIRPGDLDLARFEAALEAARTALDGGDAAAARAGVLDGLALWRGPPFADVPLERALQEAVPRIEALKVSAQELAAEAAIRLGRHDEVLAELETLIVEHPLHERFREQLILSLYRSGRQADALEAYQATRRLLVDELGIEPGRRLRELHQAILEQDPALEAPRERGRPAHRPQGVFVGRESELDELMEGVSDAFAGRGRLFLVAGEPGIGKSRLAEELAAAATQRGACVLVGRCWEAGGAPAYWPWIQALRAHARSEDASTLRAQLGGGAAELVRILPEIAARFPELSPAPGEADGARVRLFDAIAGFLHAAGESRPLVVVLDDLHAADAPSLLLLRFLARGMAKSRVIVVGAYRDVDPAPGPALLEALGDVSREPVTRRLTLRGLDEPDIARLVELGAAGLAPEQLAPALHAAAEGNPLFAGELLRLLVAEGASRTPDGALRLGIPPSVHDVIARRLARLSEPCRRSLVLASVLGRDVRLPVLARLCSVSEDEVLEHLDEAMAAGVMSETPGSPGQLRFGHVLIRDSLYDALTAARRVRLHRLAVVALEEVHGPGGGSHMAELAYHAIAGNAFDQAVAYAEQAGDRELGLLAFEEAARHYATALGALDRVRDPSDETRCRLLLALGDARRRAGEGSAAKEAFAAAAVIARQAGLAGALARAAAGYAGPIPWARPAGDERVVPLLEEGLEAVGIADSSMRARLLARLAGALRNEPSRARRDALSREAVDVARRVGDRAALAHALAGRAYAILAPDTVEECLTLGGELCATAARDSDAERLVTGHMMGVIAHLTLGRMAHARVEHELATRAAERLREPARLWEVSATRALLALATGALAEAEELIDATYALGEPAVAGDATTHLWVQRYTLGDFRGELGGVEQGVRDLVNAHSARPVFRCVLAHIHARSGQVLAARAALADLGRDRFASIPFDQEWLYALSLLAETAVRVGESAAAQTLYALLEPWAGYTAVDVGEGYRGSLQRYLGLLAVAAGRPDDAAGHFEQALIANEAMGARPWLARCQADYAQLLLTHTARADRRRGEELLDGARTSFRELGMGDDPAPAAPHAAPVPGV